MSANSFSLQRFWLITTALMSSLSSLAFAAPQYTIRSIGDSDFIPNSINRSSQIAGSTSPYSNSALWNSGTATTLSPAGLNTSSAFSINDVGQVVGWGFNGQNIEQGFLWDPSEGFINFPTPAGQTTLLNCITNSGQIGGRLRPEAVPGPDIAAIWNSPSSSPTYLPPLGTGDSSVQSINSAGIAVGISGNSYDDFYPLNPNAAYGLAHAVLWQNGQVLDLTPSTPWSYAVSINNRNQVAGYRLDPTSGASIPFVWDATNGLRDLPSGPQGASTAAINDNGLIIGTIDNDGSGSHSAALWDDDGTLYDLNTLTAAANSGWDLQYANAINNEGMIVGYGTYNGQQEGFLLTPVNSIPDPADIGVLLPSLLLFRRVRS